MSEPALRATGKWRLSNIPKDSWKCIDIEDLGSSSATCEMCESQYIRYVHYMQHPTYRSLLGCGCVCAGHMEGNEEGAERREASLRASASRRLNWVTREWRVSKEGNQYLNADRYRAVVFPRANGKWGCRVKSLNTHDAVELPRIHSTVEAAKLNAFDAIVVMKAYFAEEERLRNEHFASKS